MNIMRGILKLHVVLVVVGAQDNSTNDIETFQPIEDDVLNRLVDKQDGPFERKIKKLLVEYLIATAVESVSANTTETIVGRAIPIQQYQQQPQVVYVYGTPPPPPQNQRRTKPPRRPSHHHHHHQDSSEERTTTAAQPVVVYLPPQQQPPYNPQYPQYQPPQYQPQAPPQYQPQAPPQYQPQAPPQYQPQAPPQYQPQAPPQYQPQAPAAPQYQPQAPPQYQPHTPSPPQTQPKQPLDAPQDSLPSSSNGEEQTTQSLIQNPAQPTQQNVTVPLQGGVQQPAAPPKVPVQPQYQPAPPQNQPQAPVQPQYHPAPPQYHPAPPPPPVQVIYIQPSTTSGPPTTPGSTTTPRPRPSQQHVYNQVNKILDNVAYGNITGIVDQALGIRTPMPTRNFVNGILNTVFCNPINRLLGRCRG